MEYYFNPQWELISIQIELKFNTSDVWKQIFLEKCCAIFDATSILKSAMQDLISFKRKNYTI